MPEKVTPGPIEDSRGIREAVCIHTRKIFDSARDKDCLENLRFYPMTKYVDVINRAISVKGGDAKLLHVYVDVEPVNFNRGFYTVDMRFFYEVTLQVYMNCASPVSVKGLCVFDKRAILFGSEGTAKVYVSGNCCEEECCTADCKPTAVVEAVDPIVLDAKLVDSCGRHGCDCELCEVPSFVSSFFDAELSCGEECRLIYVTLGQFSTVRLERDAQLLIPVYEYCIPSKECTCEDRSEDPCSVFKKIQFPVNEFFPPNSIREPEEYSEAKNCCHR